jgi:acyl-CoA synthetase (AMP-forming)/AMP-acid ligase II
VTDGTRLPPVGLLGGYRAHAAHRARELAVADDTGEYTFGELWQAAERLAGRLSREGVGPGDSVGIAMEGSAANVTAIIAVLLAGGAAAPLNTALTGAELERYLDILEPAGVVADGRGLSCLPGRARPIELDTDPAAVRLEDRVGVGERDSACDDGFGRPAESPALLFPTGGTTGLPKAAILSHRATLLWAASMAGHGRAGSGVELFFLPFFHVGLLTGLLSTLHAGGPAIVQARFDPEKACDRIVRDGATRLQVVPTHIRRLQDASGFERARLAIRDVRFGGMASAPDLVDHLLEELPNAHLSTGYGATEFGPVTLVSHADLVAGRRRGVGRPVAGVHITVVSEDGVPVGAGTPGDVVVRCPWQASGYVGRPEESAAAFTPAGVRLADCGRLDDNGWLTLLGRRSDMVITGGENVFPAEIEAVLTAHPDVADIVVIGVPDATWGERIEAAVVPRSGATVTTESLRAFGRDRLAPYKLPRSVRLLDRIPLTPTNKPDRQALQADATADPSGDSSGRISATRKETHGPTLDHLGR